MEILPRNVREPLLVSPRADAQSVDLGDAPVASNPITGLDDNATWLAGLQAADAQRALDQALETLVQTAPAQPAHEQRPAAEPATAQFAVDGTPLYLRWSTRVSPGAAAVAGPESARPSSSRSSALAAEHPEHVAPGFTPAGIVRAALQMVEQARETGRNHAAALEGLRERARASLR